MKKYSCKNCNAELYWDAKSKSLKCEYCGSEFQPTDFEKSQEDNISQIADKVDKNTTATDESNSLELVMYKCTECGAEIITAKSTIATTCAYCGRAIALTDKLVGNFKPDYVIPFTISEKKAKAIYKKYCKSTFLTPRHFKKENEIKKIKGIYVPFWLHSFQNNANAVLLCENTSTKRDGDDKVIIKHKYSVNMSTIGNFDKIPTDGLKNLNNSLMDAIEPFDYSHMEKFNPAYMAGYYAEEYNETDDETKKRAFTRAETAMKQEIINNAGNYEKKAISLYNDKILKYKSDYIMLPVWLFNTEYKGKKYTFAINGDTGKIAGKLPISISKIFISSFITFIASQIIAFIIRIFG